MRKPRAPIIYLLTVSPRVCECKLPARELATANNLKTIEEKAGFYWQLFLSFFGWMNPFLQFVIVDMRDGTVLWRNGRREAEENWHGQN